MGRPAKSLLEHVEDGSFRARTHAHLLDTSPLVPDPAQRSIQCRHRRARRDETRQKIALEFERSCSQEPEPALPRARAGDELTETLEQLGPRGSAERIINFFPRFLWHTKGPLAGRPFELEEWQQKMIRDSFRRGPGAVFRWLFRRIYWIIPGGNGKTPLAAGLGLLALCELEDAPEVYCLAGAKDQADLAHELARVWVEGTDDRPSDLARYLRVRGRRILNKRTGGRMTVLASSGAILEGRQPSVVIVDELHAFEHKKQVDSYTALSGKLHKRPDSYLLAISTAGRGEDNILRRIIKAALKYKDIVRRGYLTICRNEADGIILYMWAAPAKAPLHGKAGLDVIRRCNPASWIEPRDIVQQLADAGAGEAEFRRLARNEWVGSRSQWMPVGAWEKRADSKRGKPPPKTAIALAFDGSYNNDATYLVGCTLDKHLFVVDGWERPEGDPEWVVPRDLVKQAVDEAMRTYKVINLLCDPPGWYDEVEEWGRKYQGVITVKFFTNEIKLMAQACREFYADVVNPKGGSGLTHDGDERLARHIANAYTKETADGAYITKERRDSLNKIDAAIAAVLARYGAVRAKPQSRRPVSW